jgi:hypothetical protein
MKIARSGRLDRDVPDFVMAGAVKPWPMRSFAATRTPLDADEAMLDDSALSRLEGRAWRNA